MSLRAHLRWRDYVPLFRRYNALDRAWVIQQRYAPLLTGTILDVCCGSTYPKLRAMFGDRYQGLDIGESYKYQPANAREIRPDYLCNVEREPLPFPDGSFDTVMCIGALEHLDNIHEVYDELFRVSRQRVLVMLPNNWVGFISSFVMGHNYTHRAGYGLSAEKKRPGERHKYFFNLEEAAAFLLGRAPDGWSASRVDCSFEPATDSWLAWRPYAIAAAMTPRRLVHRFGPLKGIAIAIARAAVFYPVRVAEWLAGLLFWGLRGRVVYHNLMCREIWVLLENTTDSRD